MWTENIELLIDSLLSMVCGFAFAAPFFFIIGSKAKWVSGKLKPVIIKTAIFMIVMMIVNFLILHYLI
jgi:hypothetical protein